jgi:hypothetical protein
VRNDRLKDWLTRRGWLEPGGFLARPHGALALTMACAALLLTLGYEAAQHTLGPGLDDARRELAEQTTRANRLEQENRQMESRLAQVQAQLDSRAGKGRLPEDGSREGQGAPLRVLHQGETLTLLEGKVSLTLQAVLNSPRRALMRLKPAGAQEKESALLVGQEMPFKLGRQSWSLTLRTIHASSVGFSLQPMEE